MKVCMFVGMAGITGVAPGRHNEVTEDERQLLQLSDVNAAIEGALESGAADILVQMAHRVAPQTTCDGLLRAAEGHTPRETTGT